jgi:ATP-dependent RNA helicase MSS116
MGFSKDMQRIIQILDQYKCNDGQSRQTLLFSATIPPALRSIMESGLRKDHITVDCVEDIDPTTHTNESVHQTFLTLPDPKEKMVRNDLYRLSPKMKKINANSTSDVSQYRWISGLVDIVEDIIHVQNPTDYKIVVFFPTTAATQFFSYIFNNVYNISVIEMHSQKHQSNRTSCSKLFRNTRQGILFTTDVSGEYDICNSSMISIQHQTNWCCHLARGVDYPNVTHVIQYGAAENRATCEFTFCFTMPWYRRYAC